MVDRTSTDIVDPPDCVDKLDIDLFSLVVAAHESREGVAGARLLPPEPRGARVLRPQVPGRQQRVPVAGPAQGGQETVKRQRCD